MKIYKDESNNLIIVPGLNSSYLKISRVGTRYDKPRFILDLMNDAFFETKNYIPISIEQKDNEIKELLNYVTWYLIQIYNKIETYSPNSAYSPRISYIDNPNNICVCSIIEHKELDKILITDYWCIEVMPHIISITNMDNMLHYDNEEENIVYPVKPLSMLEKATILSIIKTNLDILRIITE